MADCNSELTEQLTAAAQEPKRAAVDGQEAESHPLRDQLEVAKFLAQNKSGKRKAGIGLVRVVPPGAVE